MNEETPAILVAKAKGVPPCLFPICARQKLPIELYTWVPRKSSSIVRKLPESPEKRRTQIIKRLYQHLEHFQALLESGQMEMPAIVTIPDTAEDIYLADLMVGIDSLPPQQRRAFELICLAGWTETDATKVILPGSRWSTPTQQYADTALARMIASYDQYQLDGSIPPPYQDKRKKRVQKILGIPE